ncbi:hypothetical protein AADZ86_11335 [Colwelliaceae bacterium BS250]
MLSQKRYNLLFMLLAVAGIYLSIHHALFILLSIMFIYQCYFVPCNLLSRKLFKREIIIPIPGKIKSSLYWPDYCWLVVFLSYWGVALSGVGEVANCLSGFPYWDSYFSFCNAN